MVILYSIIFLVAQWLVIFGIAKLIDILNQNQEWYKKLDEEN